MGKSAIIRARVQPNLKQDAEQVFDNAPAGSPSSAPAAARDYLSDLASLYKRLEELDEWRTFAHELAALKLRP